MARILSICCLSVLLPGCQALQQGAEWWWDGVTAPVGQRAQSDDGVGITLSDINWSYTPEETLAYIEEQGLEGAFEVGGRGNLVFEGGLVTGFAMFQEGTVELLAFRFPAQRFGAYQHYMEIKDFLVEQYGAPTRRDWDFMHPYHQGAINMDGGLRHERVFLNTIWYFTFGRIELFHDRDEMIVIVLSDGYPEDLF